MATASNSDVFMFRQLPGDRIVVPDRKRRRSQDDVESSDASPVQDVIDYGELSDAQDNTLTAGPPSKKVRASKASDITEENENGSGSVSRRETNAENADNHSDASQHELLSGSAANTVEASSTPAGVITIDDNSEYSDPGVWSDVEILCVRPVPKPVSEQGQTGFSHPNFSQNVRTSIPYITSSMNSSNDTINMDDDARRQRRPNISSSQMSTANSTFGETQTPQQSEWENYDDSSALEVIDLSQDYDDTTYTGHELYGTLATKIVGVRYYSGRATMGEFVVLKREPTNQYDSNAIRVLNVQQEQIGHIPKSVSAKLAKYMDARTLLVEGVLTGSVGNYDCPIALKLFGPTDPVASADLVLSLQEDRLPIGDLTKSQNQALRRQEEDMAAEQSHLSADFQNTGMSHHEATSGSPEASSSRASGLDLDDPRKVGEAAETLATGEEALSRMPMADAVKDINTTLLPHQLQGLKWMLDHENPKLPAAHTDDIVQLWQASKSKFSLDCHTNIATNFTVRQPSLASGGILADDMGLGKTLQTIALIMEDRRIYSSHGPTLIVTPVSVMGNWRDQIASHVAKEKALKVLMYHGPVRKSMTEKGFLEYDVVITTYGAVSHEYQSTKDTDPAPIPRRQGLFSVHWRRIVLDEGHIIRNPATKGSKSVTALLAKSKWVLTGTPIVNNIKDLYSLLRFIGITGGLENLEMFNTCLVRPLKRGNHEAQELLQTIMANICLRRKKEMNFVNLCVPEMTEHIHRIKFLPEEKEKYDAFASQAKGLLRQLNLKLGGKTISSHLLAVLLRMRQICNHWRLCKENVTILMDAIAGKGVVDLTPENIAALHEMLQLSIDQQEECPICLDPLHEPVITACAHVFGFNCIERVISMQHKCPMCRAELATSSQLIQPKAQLGESTDGEDMRGSTAPSSKVTALLDLLKTSHQTPGNKVVVFSQWTKFLDIVENHLVQEGYNYTRLDGTMKATKRDAAVTALQTDEKCTIMLASLAVCSVGLNLTAANQVILADSWWAPAIEDQAVDRVHRLGQTRPTTVFRLLMEDSIEERVLEIQNNKRSLMHDAFGEGEKDNVNTRNTARLAELNRLLE